MADMLRVTSPVINKGVAQPGKAPKDSSIPFDLQEIQNIARAPAGYALSQRGVIQNEAGAATLMNLLKDPAVTISYLKNIYLLEEIINLLPVNNSTMTQEIRQLFDSLLIDPGNIVEELADQENASTMFRGPLFDFLRDLLEARPELRGETANLLKALNGSVARQDVLDSVGNSLDFLAEQLAGSKSLAPRFTELAAKIRSVEEHDAFGAAKAEILLALEELESSILHSPHTARVIPNILYNLSRYQDNDSFLQEALLNVLVHVNGREEKDTLKRLVREYLEEFRTPEHQENRSRIMDTLARIIEKQDRETPMNSLNGEKIEKIITSLLSSPCNYTPLLHFVIPVDYHGMKAFSELWIDPRDEREGEDAKDSGDRIHVLVSFDIPGIGQMEAEFKVADRDMSFLLFSPETYQSVFDRLMPEFRRIIESHGYRVVSVESRQMDHVRSLMDVFENLPYKRTGIDVKI